MNIDYKKNVKKTFSSTSGLRKVRMKGVQCSVLSLSILRASMAVIRYSLTSSSKQTPIPLLQKTRNKKNSFINLILAKFPTYRYRRAYFDCAIFCDPWPITRISLETFPLMEYPFLMPDESLMFLFFGMMR